MCIAGTKLPPDVNTAEDLERVRELLR
jgi:hypothetical protein